MPNFEQSQTPSSEVDPKATFSFGNELENDRMLFSALHNRIDNENVVTDTARLNSVFMGKPVGEVQSADDPAKPFDPMEGFSGAHYPTYEEASQKIKENQEKTNEKLGRIFESVGRKKVWDRFVTGVVGSTVEVDDFTAEDDVAVTRILGDDTSPESAQLATTAAATIRESLSNNNGDHDRTRKDLLRKYHADVSNEDPRIAAYFNSAWDSEKKQFKV